MRHSVAAVVLLACGLLPDRSDAREGPHLAALGAPQAIFRSARQQPNIQVQQLKTLKAPTLVMAGDRDVIRGEHSLEIFQALPNAQLAIFPGATHMIPWQNPELFNQTVETFFAKPFTKPDTKDILSAMMTAN